ncbi:uncharacterized protein RSE6_08962 [Rhynchosporium secalis]|uniref:Uncharacterized protein n=1 Tax=Rhynchosporium secalis TaxID=38038 RepID=A0A1E1MGW1_RHYSE|nr:uncharacterized protein RSE6_08962 [Rhynchosporium secalis]
MDSRRKVFSRCLPWTDVPRNSCQWLHFLADVNSDGGISEKHEQVFDSKLDGVDVLLIPFEVEDEEDLSVPFAGRVSQID